MRKLVFFLLLIAVGLSVWFLANNRLTSSRKKVDTAPDYSPTRTIQEVGNTVVLNLEQCTPDVRRVDVAFGSTTLEIIGREGASCNLNYGGEVENPNWNGVLTNRCKIPQILKSVTFGKTNYGVDLSAIQKYCVESK